MKNVTLVHSQTPGKVETGTLIIGTGRTGYQLESLLRAANRESLIMDATEVLQIGRDGDSFRITDTRNNVWHAGRIVVADSDISTLVFDEGCRPRYTADSKIPQVTSAFESINIRDLYFAACLTGMGDLETGLRAFHRILEARYFDQPWPHQRIPSTASAIAAHVLARVRHSAGPLQRRGFLCDLLILARDGGDARYYEEPPTAYVHDSAFGRYADYYTITSEVVHRYSRGALINAHRVAENLVQYFRSELKENAQ